MGHFESGWGPYFPVLFFLPVYSLSICQPLLMWMQDVLFQTSGVVFPLTNYTSFPHSHCVRVTAACATNTLKKKVGRVHLVQAGQVKHECNRLQMWHRSLVWGVCMLKWMHQKVPTSCINVVCSLSFLGVLDYIIKSTHPDTIHGVLAPQVVCVCVCVRRHLWAGYRNVCW